MLSTFKEDGRDNASSEYAHPTFLGYCSYALIWSILSGEQQQSMSLTRRKIVGVIFLVLFSPVAVYAYFQLFAFVPQFAYSVASEPLDLEVQDVTGDGLDDVLVAHRAAEGISVLLGNGDGSLTAHDFVALPFGATSLAVGDITRDGHKDVVVSVCGEHCKDNGIVVLRGDGLGNFYPELSYKVEGVPYNITVADFDRDGTDDFVVSDYPSGVLRVFWRQDGNEELTHTALPSGAKPVSLAVEDLNSDEFPDLVVANHGQATLSIFLNRGGREFEVAQEIAVADLPYSVVAKDMNNDGRVDILSAHSGPTGEVFVFEGHGDGHFTQAAHYETDGRLIFITANDFNQDSLTDIIVTRERGEEASVFLGAPQNFRFRPEFRIPSGNSVYASQVANLNGDSLLDLIDIDFSSGILTVSAGQIPVDAAP